MREVRDHPSGQQWPAGRSREGILIRGEGYGGAAKGESGASNRAHPNPPGMQEYEWRDSRAPQGPSALLDIALPTLSEARPHAGPAAGII